MKKTKKIARILGVLVIVSGICIIVYPYLKQKIYKIEVQKIIEDFENRIQENEDENTEETSDDKEKKKSRPSYEELYRAMQEYNRNLFEDGQGSLLDPFAYEVPTFNLVDWGLKDGMIGSISIPKMDIKLPIYLGASTDNMAKGAAHMSQTSLPIGGINTNAVIVAHRGYSYAAMFRDIEALELGDEMIIRNFHDILCYKVVEIKVISPTDIDQVFIQPNRDLVTLATCHPYRHNYQRYLVFCERVTNEEKSNP